MPDGMKVSSPEVPKTPERIVSPETPKDGVVEVGAEKRPAERAPASTEKETIPIAVPLPTVPSSQVSVAKSQIQQDIEDILADDLKELYQTLSPAQKIQFRKEGEKTAARIEVLLKSVKIKVSEVLHLIRAWLSLLPGVNKFFLEKEVKIKTERILGLKEEDE